MVFRDMFGRVIPDGSQVLHMHPRKPGIHKSVVFQNKDGTRLIAYTPANEGIVDRDGTRWVKLTSTRVYWDYDGTPCYDVILIPRFLSRIFRILQQTFSPVR